MQELLGTDSNPSSSSSSNSSNGRNIRACSISAPSKPSLDLLISYLDDVLSAIIDKGPHSKRNDGEIKLKDIVQPIASDFSKLLEGISQGANMFSDQKSSTSKLSSEVETVALNLLKGLGKAHWVAAGLLVIANVLERFDKISSNDRECTDLLRGMLDLAKVVKRLKDINADFHKDILEKMKEAVHLVVSGAILCHSFITCNKISKFLLTTKIREELVYVRGKVDRIIRDLGIQTELTILSTLTFNISRQQQHNDNEGGTEETRYPTEEFALQQGNLGGANIHCEIEKTSETHNHEMEVQSASNGQVEYGCYKKQPLWTDNSKSENGNQPQVFLPHLIPRPARMFKTIARVLNKIAGHIFEGREGSVQSDWDWVIAQNFRDIKWEKTASGFKSPLEAGIYRSVYKGKLNDGRQVGVKIAPNGSREEIYGLIKDRVFTRYLHHRNIMKTHEFCIGRRGLMLVCDYMPTLSDILFDPIKKQVLDWRRRFNVILEVIRALAYLHEGVDVSIVHRDVTPANILLDRNLSARISNFELAIVLHDNMDDPEVAGTDGYLAPEYALQSRLTAKADIYSFGILVLNVVSGKKVFETVDNGLYILWKQALMLQKENRLIELIDPDLVNGQGFDSGDILRATMIALLCIQKDPDLRPPASRLSVMLSTKEVEIPTAPTSSETEVLTGSLDDNNVCSSPLSVLTGSLDDSNVCSIPSSVFNGPR